MDIGPQRIKVVEAVRALKTALKCAICQGTFRPNPITTNCDHTFCQECFSSWMLKSTDRKCPVCLTAVQRRSCKPSPEVADYVNRYLILAKVFQETLKTFNVPPEHEFFESQIPPMFDSFVAPSPSPVFATPFSFGRNPRRKLDSKPKSEIGVFDEIFAIDSDPVGPSAKRRKTAVSKTKKERPPSDEGQSASTNAGRNSPERTPPSVAAAVASLVQESVHKEIDLASEQSSQGITAKTSRSRARSLKTPKKPSVSSSFAPKEQPVSPLRKPTDDEDQQQTVVVKKSPESVTKSDARSKSLTPEATVAASTDKRAATRRSSRSKSGTPQQTFAAPAFEQKTPDDNQQSQQSNKSTSKKRKVYWDWVTVPDDEATAPTQPYTSEVAPSPAVRALRASTRLTSVRHSIDGAVHDEMPELDVSHVSTEGTGQQQASAMNKDRRSAMKPVSDGNAQGGSDAPQVDTSGASTSEKRTNEQQISKKRNQSIKKTKEEADQEDTPDARQLNAASSLTETIGDYQMSAPNRKRKGGSTASKSTTADSVKASVDEQCQTDAKVITDACVQTTAASEAVDMPANEMVDERKKVAAKEKRATEMTTREAQTDAYPVGFDDVSFECDDSDEQFERDSRAIMSDTYLSDRVDVRRRLWRMTRANVQRLMATYPGASRVALLFRILPCFSDIINTREALQQLVSIAQGNIDACSEALERSMISLERENMPLFEEEPVAVNDISVSHAFDKDAIKDVRDAKPGCSPLRSTDSSMDVEKESRQKTADDNLQDIAQNDENSRRCGSPLPSARIAPVVALPLTPSRRPLESNDLNVSNNGDIEGLIESLKKAESYEDVEDELLSTQPPSAASSMQLDGDVDETRHSPDMFLSQTSLALADAKEDEAKEMEQMEDDDQSDRTIHSSSAVNAPIETKESIGDDRRSSRGQSADSTSVISETPSTLMNANSGSIRSQTASEACVGFDETADEVERAQNQTGKAGRENVTIVSDVVGETPTQQLPLDAQSDSMQVENGSGQEETPVSGTSNMIILVSKPRQNDAALLSQFEQLTTGCRVVKRWEDSVTHLVMMDAETRQITQRTIKYAVGIAAKVFVVGRRWIEDSLGQGKVLDPRSYEIIGDSVATTYAAEKSRLSSTKLFEGYSFYLPPRFFGEISAGTVERVLSMSGATVVKMEADLPPDGIILFGTGTAKVESKGYAEFADNARRYEHAFNNEVLAADFVLDGISDYKIPEDRQQYRVYKSSDNVDY
uniref:RING-type E3 ubiquitin transferase BRCA1 n=1 Tax=Plectus sambesii TaxID=2011161 RepID=A0A914WPW4_9BILA